MTTLDGVLLEPDDPRWHSALTSVDHDVYHLPDYVVLSARYEQGMPRAFWVTAAGQSLLIPLIVRPIPPLLAGDQQLFDATSPYGYPSPLWNGEANRDGIAFFERAVAAFIAVLRQQRIVTAFLRLHPLLPLPLEPLTQHGRLVRHGETVAIDLSRSEQEMWRETRRDQRRHINRAAREGFVARMDASWEHLDDFIEAYHQTMRRAGASDFYFFPRDYFDDLRRALGDRLHLSVVEIAGTVVCAGLLTEVSGIVQNHLAGTRDTHVTRSPEKTRLDFVRRWAKARGNRVFHLGGGVGGKEDSLFAFKAGFSESRHPFHTWRVVADEAACERLVERWQARHGVQPDDLDGFFPAYRRPGGDR